MLSSELHALPKRNETSSPDGLATTSIPDIGSDVSPQRCRKRSRDAENEETNTDSDWNSVTYLDKHNGVDGPAHYEQRKLLTRLSLGDLPAELLEVIAWLSLSPILPLVSKEIFNKVGHLRSLRLDMARLVFCGWAELDHKRYKLPEPKIETSRLPMQSHVAIATPPPSLTRADLHALRNVFGEFLWCDIEMLERLGTEIMWEWWTRNVPDHNSNWTSQWRSVCEFNSIVSNANGIRPIRLGFDGHMDHCIEVLRPYEARVLCNAPNDSNGSWSSEPACPYYGTGNCPKQQGWKYWKGSPTQIVFALPRVPDRVLSRPNTVAKTAEIRFYQKSNFRRSFLVYVSTDWVRKVAFRRSVITAIASAIKDHEYDTLRLLLLLEEKLGLGDTTSDYTTEQKTDYCQIHGQLILLSMVFQQQFFEVMEILKECIGRISLSPTEIFALQRLGEDFKIVTLTYADEAFAENTDEHALQMLGWWTVDLEDRNSWVLCDADHRAQSCSSATNDRAVSQSSRRIYEKVEGIRKKIKLHAPGHESNMASLNRSDKLYDCEARVNLSKDIKRLADDQNSNRA